MCQAQPHGISMLGHMLKAGQQAGPPGPWSLGRLAHSCTYTGCHVFYSFTRFRLHVEYTYIWGIYTAQARTCVCTYIIAIPWRPCLGAILTVMHFYSCSVPDLYFLFRKHAIHYW